MKLGGRPHRGRDGPGIRPESGGFRSRIDRTVGSPQDDSGAWRPARRTPAVRGHCGFGAPRRRVGPPRHRRVRGDASGARSRRRDRTVGSAPSPHPSPSAVGDVASTDVSGGAGFRRALADRARTGRRRGRSRPPAPVTSALGDLRDRPAAGLSPGRCEDLGSPAGTAGVTVDLCFGMPMRPNLDQWSMLHIGHTSLAQLRRQICPTAHALANCLEVG